MPFKKILLSGILIIGLVSCAQTANTISQDDSELPEQAEHTATSIAPTLTPVPPTPTTPVEYAFSLVQVNEDGFGIKDNIGVTALGIFNDTLYAGTINFETGAEVWRFDGAEWELMSTGGFGAAENLAVDQLFEYKGFLYAGLGALDFEGQLWRSSDGHDWERVIMSEEGLGEAQEEVMKLFVIEDYFYASTWSHDEDSSRNGFQLWRSVSGDSGTWELVSNDGLGNHTNKAILGIAQYNGKVYVSTSGEYGHVFYTENGEEWVNVPWNGDPAPTEFPALAVFNGELYAAVEFRLRIPDKYAQIYKCSVCDGSDWELVFDDFLHEGGWRKLFLEKYDNYLYMAIGNDTYGMELWRTNDGSNWELVSGEGLGDVHNRRSYWDNANIIFNGELYFGVTNYDTGGEVWKVQHTLP